MRAEDRVGRGTLAGADASYGCFAGAGPDPGGLLILPFLLFLLK